MGKQRNGGVSREEVQQREQDAWALRRRGWSQARIAEELGVSQKTISKALKRVGDKYLKELMKDVASVKAAQIEQLEHIRDEAMEAWRKSQLVYQEVTVRSQRVKEGDIQPEDEAGLDDWEEPEEGDGEKRLHIRTIVTRLQVGDTRYLSIAMQASAEIRKVMGIDNSNRVYALLFEKIDWERITPSQLKRLEAGEDPLNVIIGVA